MHVDPKIHLFLHTANNPVFKPVFCIQIRPSKINHFTLFQVELHLPLLSPSLHPVNVPLKPTTVLHTIHNSSNLCVIGKPLLSPFFSSFLAPCNRLEPCLILASSTLINLLTIGILSQGKCGLSKCVTRYLVAMAVADLLVIILDLILRHIPTVYWEQFQFLWSIRLCNIHAVLLYAATDCSVWFTVTFTFDRFVAICCQKLKSKYCSEKTSAVVVGTVTVLSCLNNIFWYFMFGGRHLLGNEPWFCDVTMDVRESRVWTTIEFFHYILTPGFPFVVILLLNALTVRHISVSNRGRRRLLAHSNGKRHRDPEMETRRKSIILLSVISGNFMLLWATLMVFSIWNRLWYLGPVTLSLPGFLLESGFMLQLLSCCTNTAIYAVTQTQFRQQLKNVLTYPFTTIVKFIQ
ncbi:probable G-protein coupled receptor 139 [Heterodontus francisci]|uniref:probable G-protein coupled receptor 139 n=1 Tax=Heterodontus francisci TaxID=7792 RepID=UPI00355BCCCF